MTVARSESQHRRSSVIDRYELIAKLGSGGMGEVFLARARGEAGFERLLAIKLIHSRGKEEQFTRTLLNEARLASRIQHTNVVTVLDVGAHPDGQYLVMEYIEGCTLSEMQRRHRDEPLLRFVAPVIVDALFGLHAAHSAKDDAGVRLDLVHRDFTPQNLLIGVDGACRVTDFGIARAGNLLRGTNTGVVKGKPPYMSPEQIAGGPIDHRSDIFSAGVILWNALTGKKLFHGPSTHASMFYVLKRKIPKPSLIGMKPPTIFDSIVMKALERDPNKRFHDAEEMALALREAAITSGHLAAPSEVGSWIATSFADALEARRRIIRDTMDGSKKRIEGSPPVSLARTRESKITATDLQDLSILSDEVDAAAQMLTPGNSSDIESIPRSGTKRWIVATGLCAAVIVLGAFGWVLTTDRPPGQADQRPNIIAPIDPRPATPATEERPREAVEKAARVETIEPPPAAEPAVPAIEPDAAERRPHRVEPKPIRRSIAKPSRRDRADEPKIEETAPRRVVEDPERPPSAPEKKDGPKTDDNPYLWN